MGADMGAWNASMRHRNLIRDEQGAVTAIEATPEARRAIDQAGNGDGQATIDELDAALRDQVVAFRPRGQAEGALAIVDVAADCKPSRALDTSGRLRFSTWNVFGVSGLPGSLAIAERDDTALRFRHMPEALRGSDVVAVQEAFTHEGNRLVDSFPFGYRETDLRGDLTNSGLGVLSRYPVVERGFHEFETGVGSDGAANKGVTFTRMYVPTIGFVDVYNTHLQANYADRGPGSDSDPTPIMADDAPFTRIGTREGLFAHYEGVQNGQVEELIAFVRAHSPEGYPVIFAGDLNITPDRPAYRRLMEGLSTPGAAVRDAYLEAHGGNGAPTVVGTNPLNGSDEVGRRLDYVLVRGPVRVAAASVQNDTTPLPVFDMDYPLSDHQRVQVDLRLLPQDRAPAPLAPVSTRGTVARSNW